MFPIILTEVEITVINICYRFQLGIISVLRVWYIADYFMLRLTVCIHNFYLFKHYLGFLRSFFFLKGRLYRGERCSMHGSLSKWCNGLSWVHLKPEANSFWVFPVGSGVLEPRPSCPALPDHKQGTGAEVEQISLLIIMVAQDSFLNGKTTVTGKERDFPPNGSFLKWPQRPRLARSLECHPSLPDGWQGTK